MTTLQTQDTSLVAQAELIAAKAYAPYSNYFVGAVVRARDGREFAGVNVENAAYPLTICAEKNAISAAVAAGCRQWLYEFKIKEVSYKGEDGLIRTKTPSDLLPDTWNLP